MAVNRVILQQFSMQLNYLNNKERSNIYQPSVKAQQQQQEQQEQLSSSSDSFLMPELPPPLNQARQLSSSDDDDLHFDKCSESSSRCSQPMTPSEQSSDEDIQTILDNVLIANGSAGINNILSKCDDAASSPLQSRRRQARPLYIVCPTPSG
jgi:hypothetical protein